MDLNTVETILHPCDRQSMPVLQSGDAFLAGGTWLFSEPQTDLIRLIDLASLGWRPYQQDKGGIEIAATCTLAELEDMALPAVWTAGALIAQCCRALLGSFKIRYAATVGGNLCLSLPAGPMAPLLSALDGMCSIWTPDGGERRLLVKDFIVDANRNALRAGEVLRAVNVPADALSRRAAFRQMSLTPLGRSAALVIGTCSFGKLTLTIAASVARPIQFSFQEAPTAASLAARIDEEVATWYDDVHGAPMWRRRITHILAREIVSQLGSL